MPGCFYVWLEYRVSGGTTGVLPATYLVDGRIRTAYWMGSMQTATPPTLDLDLHARIDQFIARSEAGEFYEDFLTNAQMCECVTNGTEDWLVAFQQLLDEVVQSIEGRKDVSREHWAGVREDLRKLFELFDHARKGDKRIVFLTDAHWDPSISWRHAVLAYLLAADETQRDAAVQWLTQRLPASQATMIRNAARHLTSTEK